MTAQLFNSLLRRALLRSNCAVIAITLSGLVSEAALAQNQLGPVDGTIEYGYWGNARRAGLTEAVSRAFETAHPGAKVQGIVAEYAAYVERLTVQAAAGELPCVTQTQSTFLATYATRGVLMPLDDLVQSGGIDVSGIPDEILATGRIGGKLFMLPTGTFLRLVAYNAAMAELYGIAAPPKRGTFDEYKQWLLTSQKKLPQGVYAAENEGANLFTFYSWIAGHGQKFFEKGALGFEPALLTQYFEFWEGLRKAGAVVPADRLDEQFGAVEVTPLSRGHVLSATRDIPQIFQAEQTLATANLPSEIEFARNPVATGAKSGNVPGTNGLSISANCDNIATAAAYLNFFGNDPRAAVAFKSANGVIVSQAGQKALLDSKSTPENVRESLETLSAIVADGDITPASYPSGYQTLPNLLRRIYEDVALKGQSPAEAAKRFFDEASRTLR
ncbi:extracellular solute-binding protein [Mesorhizobium sp. YR577]|uniref:ABC transporter substrate-binding protein n=1 Tax=Mesorhizobium sp. YR577 TaxID=1884373 RepID=UPI0008E8139D|nr:extracellular solute-binding protein [Mesorhizobium sp. YR577]SFU21906.1 multiple sugar transport system substrate-binding protein [Mesorhizobium sp. YR577]